jgi:hypothetical protein
VGPRDGTPQVHPAWASCPADGLGGDEALTLPLLDDSFRPVRAVVCGSGSQKRPDGGTDAVAVEDRADDIAALLAALRLPDEPRTDGPCAAVGFAGPWLALLDEQGRWIRPGLPVTECEWPRPELRAAVDDLTLSRVDTRVLQETESAEAAAADCSQQAADMVWATAEYADVADARLAGDDAPVRLCVYVVPERLRGDVKPVGDFESGGPLPAQRWTAVRRHLAAAAPATACGTPASRFALLFAVGMQAYVELDGCRRALVPAVGPTPAAYTVRQAPTAVVTLLEQQL